MASIRKRGKKYQVQVRRRGQPPISRSFVVRTDALVWARTTERRADLGEIGPATTDLKTLGDLIKRYIAEVLPAKRSEYVERYLIGAVLRDPICDIPIATISPRVFGRWRDKRLGEVGPAAVARQLTILRHVFEVARKEWALPIQQNPVALISKPPLPPARDRRLGPHELEALVTGCRGCLNQLVSPTVHFAIATAMRQGEILSARWEHLDLANRVLLIPHTKNGKPRRIPLSPEAIAIIGGLPRLEPERIFPMSTQALKLAWRRLVKRAGITNLHFHDLRHEAISRFFERGLSIAEVALISGHRDVRMLFRYTHLRAEDVAKKLL